MASGESSAEPRLESLVCEYIDRFNGGELLSEEDILADHPDLGPEAAAEVFRQLSTFASAGEGAEELPREFGNYTLRRRLGSGGMGVVYEAWQAAKQRTVAIKRLRGGRGDVRAIVRFAREAQLASRLRHENIVHVYGMAVEEETPFYVMEFVEGKTLEVESADPFGLGRDRSRENYARLATAFAEAADGIEHAHRNGIVHRDIKPSNLILDLKGHLRVLDFGLAFVDGDENLTVTHEVVGTAAFMSPEQIQGRERVDRRTDIYSLGASLYAVLGWRPPFAGGGRDEVLLEVLQNRPRPLRDLAPAIPVELELIVERCLEKEREDRYASAATSLSGRLIDTNSLTDGEEVPVVGAVVSLLGTDRSAVSGPDGDFLLENTPADIQILDIDTSTAEPGPDSAQYASFRERIRILRGVPNVVDRPFYLPRLDLTSARTVVANEPTVVHSEEINSTLTVHPNAAVRDGAPFTGELTLSVLPRALAPAALPANLGPGLLVTVQPVGVVFTEPASLTLANTHGLPAGGEAEIWSLDPETGRFVVVGKGQVNDEGTLVETVEGGVRAADWHLVSTTSLSRFAWSTRPSPSSEGDCRQRSSTIR